MEAASLSTDKSFCLFAIMLTGCKMFTGSCASVLAAAKKCRLMRLQTQAQRAGKLNTQTTLTI